jgi:hypothetical protein
MKTRIFVLVAGLAAVSATPAFADWDRLGSVQVSPGRDVNRVYGSFGGPIEKLYLDADQTNVYCRSVTLKFANGRTRNVFTGTLREDQGRTIDLPGRERNVRSITFRCRSLARRSGRIQISADIGEYRDTWRRHPSFERLWGNLFNWDDDDRGDRRGRDDRDARDDRPRGDDADWVRFGSETFSGRDRETTTPGSSGRNVSAIGLRPTDDDAQCTSLRVHFGNGNTRDIPINATIREDRMHRIDLPGAARNIEEMELICRPIGDDEVTIDIYGLS